MMLESGADVTAVDSAGYNVVHGIVAMCKMTPTSETKMQGAFNWLLSNLNTAAITTLMTMENHCGFRPLEFAAQQDCLSLFAHLLMTPTVYVTKKEAIGLACYWWIDVTEYERGVTSHLCR